MIVLNHLTGTSAITRGARAYLLGMNPGNGAERIEIVVRSRSGRYIRKWESIKRLGNFRHSNRVLEDRLARGLVQKFGTYMESFGPSDVLALENARLYWLNPKA